MASLSRASFRSRICFDCSGETSAASSNLFCARPRRAFALAGSCVVNQDLAHRSGRHGKKVRPVRKAWFALVRQTQISLVDQRRRLQRVIGTLPLHIMMSETSKFLINERGQLLERSIVPMAPVR